MINEIMKKLREKYPLLYEQLMIAFEEEMLCLVDIPENPKYQLGVNVKPLITGTLIEEAGYFSLIEKGELNGEILR